MNWNDGDDVIIISPALTDDDAAARFPDLPAGREPDLDGPGID